MLLPNYPHFFIVTADIAPKTGASHVESSLWYHMDPKEHDDSWLSYYTEKLGLNLANGLAFQQKWNHTLKTGVHGAKIDHMFNINSIQYAFIRREGTILILKDAPHLPPDRLTVSDGSGGNVCSVFKDDLALNDGYLTDEYLRRKLGIYDKDESDQFVTIWNNYNEKRS